MLERAREYGPVGLVPLAWTFAAAAHLGYVGERPLFVGHAVMAVLLAAFAALSWTEMADGALRAWRTVVALGVGVTALGLASFGVPAEPAGVLRAAAVVGWMLLPAWGLADTARRTPEPAFARVYRGAAAASVAGAALAVAGLAAPRSLPAAGRVVLAGIAVTGVGQTASIVAAARQNS